MNDLEVVKQSVAITPDQMLMRAVESNMDIDKLEKLLSLKERWDAKNAERSFYDAMNQFQSKKPKLVKGKKVDFPSKQGGGNIKYNYNPLPKIQEAIDPVLASCGLSYSWDQTEEQGGRIKITCVVSHVDGHSKSTFLSGAPDTSGTKNSLQSIGSTITYLKRYTLENALGLSSDEDDDGKKGGKKEEVKLPSPNENQWTKIVNKFKTGDIDLDKIKGSFTLTETQEAEIKKLIG